MPSGRDDIHIHGKATQFPHNDPRKGGRPKKYKTLFDECLNDDERKEMIEVLKTKALGGDLQAMNMIMDRVDGKPTQQHDIKTSDLIMPITILNPLDEEE